jgi:hypothetical protein
MQWFRARLVQVMLGRTNETPLELQANVTIVRFVAFGLIGKIAIYRPGSGKVWRTGHTPRVTKLLAAGRPATEIPGRHHCITSQSGHNNLIAADGRETPGNDNPMTDGWDMDLARLSIRATMLTREMLIATGRDDGERLETQATRVVDALLHLRLTAAIQAAGGRRGAEDLLADLPEISPALARGLDFLSSGVTAPDVRAQNWLQVNGDQLERAFTTARVAHMTGTAMKMNAVQNFAEFRHMVGQPGLRDLAGTPEDIAICLLSAKARGAAQQQSSR